MTGDDDDAPPEGVAYQDLPLSACCMFVVDDTRYAQRACGAEPAFAGCSWCASHLATVFRSAPSRPPVRRAMLVAA